MGINKTVADKCECALKKPGRKRLVVAGLLVFVFAMLLASYGIANTHGWGDDFSQYIAQARALAEGNVNEWYARNSFTIEHSESGLGSNAYPWMTPILIAPIYAIWGLNYIPYQLFLSLCFAIAVTALYVIMVRRQVKLGAALLICCMVITNPSYLILTKNVISDIPGFMFTVISWLLIDMYLESRSLKHAIFTGVSIFVAFAARTMALALPAAMGIIDLIYFIRLIKNKQLSKKRFAVICTPYAVFAVMFVLLSCLLPKGGSSYWTYFSLDIDRIIWNADYYRKLMFIMFTQHFEIAPTLNSFFKTYDSLFISVFSVLMIPVIILCLQGMIRRIKELDHLPLFFITTFLMLLIYGYQQGTRFIISLFPVVLLCVYYGIINAVMHIKEKQKDKAGSEGLKFSCRDLILYITASGCGLVCILSIIMGITLISIGGTLSERQPLSVNQPCALEAYSYINAHLDKNDVVIFMRPRALCLYTDVYSFSNRAALEETGVKADYILRYSGDGSYDKYINEHKDDLTEQFHNERFTLYKITGKQK